MRSGSLFALLALVPASINAAPRGPEVLVMALCNGGKVTLPTAPSPRNDNGCCAKGCHTGCSRKRLNAKFDVPQ